MSTDGQPDVDDFREAIRERLVLWSDGRQDQFEVVNLREADPLVALTASGEQLVLSPALEWLLIGEVSESELQP